MGFMDRVKNQEKTAFNAITPNTNEEKGREKYRPFVTDEMDRLWKQTALKLYNNGAGSHTPMEDAEKIVRQYINNGYASYQLGVSDPLKAAGNLMGDELRQAEYQFSTQGITDYAGLKNIYEKQGYQTWGEHSAGNRQRALDAALAGYVAPVDGELGLAQANIKFYTGLPDYLQLVSHKGYDALPENIRPAFDQSRFAQGQGWHADMPQEEWDALNAWGDAQAAKYKEENQKQMEEAAMTAWHDANPIMKWASENANMLPGYVDFYAKLPENMLMLQTGGYEALPERMRQAAKEYLSGAEAAEYAHDIMYGSSLNQTQMEGLKKYGDEKAAQYRAAGEIYQPYTTTPYQDYLDQQMRKTPEGARAWLEEVKGTEDEQAARDAIWFADEEAKYNAIPQMEDFEELSATEEMDLNVFSSEAERKYAYITDQGNTRANIDGAFNASGASNPWFSYTLMEPDEVKKYKYIYKKEGEKAADEYLEYLQYDLDARINAEMATNVYNMAAANGVDAAILNAASIFTSLGRGINYYDVLLQSIFGGDKPVNYERTAGLGEFTDAARQGTMDSVDWHVNFLGKEIDAADFLLGTLMSGADSLAASVAGPWGGAALLASSAAQNTMRNAHEGGASQGQSLMLGAGAGAFELIFEKISLDKLLKTAKATDLDNPMKWLKNIGVNALTNAEEEFSTSVASFVLEQAVLGEDSEMAKKYRRYLDLGLSEDEAEARVIQDLAWQWGEDALGGALMGSGMGFVGDVGAYQNTRKADAGMGESIIGNQAEQKILGWADSFGADSLSAKAAQKYRKHKSAANLGSVFRATMHTMGEKGKEQLYEVAHSEVQKALENAGETENAEEVAAAIVDLYGGNELDANQMKVLAWSKHGMDVAAQMIGMQETEAAPQEEGRTLKAQTYEKQEAAPQEETEEPQETEPEAPAGAEIMTEDGGTQTVAEITESEDGGAMIVTGDGTEIEVDEAPITEAQKQIAYETQGTEFAAETMGAYTSQESQLTGAQDFARGFRRIAQEAAKGKTLEEATKGLFAKKMSPAAQQAAYAAGQNARARKTAQESSANFKAAQRDGFRALTADIGSKAGLYYANVTKRITNEMKTAMRVIERFAENAGIQVQIFDTQGKANGAYQAGSNVIRLSLDADYGALTRVMSHEGYHYIKEWNKEGAEKLAAKVFEYLGKVDGYDLDQRVQEKIREYAKANVTLDPEAAKEEIVADALLDYIGTEENFRNLMIEDSNLAEKIRAWVQQMMAQIRSILDQVSKTNEEVKALKDNEAYLAEIVQMMDGIIDETRENMESTKKGESARIKNDPAVTEYREDMRTARDESDRQGALNGLMAEAFMRTQKEWIANHPEADMDSAIAEFREALSAYGRGEKWVQVALEDAGFISPTPGSNEMALLSYAGQQAAMMQEKGVKYSEKENLYNYDALIAKEDMPITWIDNVTEEEMARYKSMQTREFAKEMLGRIETRDATGAHIANKDTGKNIVVGVESVKHSIGRRLMDSYAKIAANLENILGNAIAVNELKARDEKTNYSTILIGLAEDEKDYTAVRFIINNKTWKMNDYDILYAISKTAIKKEGTDITPRGLPDEQVSAYPSEISIADLLDLVKNAPEISSVLSKDVMDKLGIARPNNAKLSGSLKYSLKESPTAPVEEGLKEDAELYTQIKASAEGKAALQILQKLYGMATRGDTYLMEGEKEALIEKGAWQKRMPEIMEKIKAETGSEINERKLRSDLAAIFNAMDRGEDVSDMLMAAKELGKDILSEAPGMMNPVDPGVKEAMRILKDSRFYLTDEMKSEIRNTQYGSVAAYMRKNFGKMGIRAKAKDGKGGARTSLAEVWMELNEILPGTFKADATEADMPGIVDAWLETAGQRDFGGAFGQNIGAYSTDLGLSIMLEYFNLPGAIAKESDLRTQYEKALLEMRTAERVKYEERIKTRKEREELNKAKEQAIKEIGSNVKYLNARIIRESNSNHIPEMMKDAVIKALGPFLKDTSVFDATTLSKLRQAYEALATTGVNGDTEAARAFDEDILDMIRTMENAIDGRRLSQLTLQELQMVRDVMANIKTMVVDANEMLVNGRKVEAENLGNEELMDLTAQKDTKHEKLLATTFKNTTPAYFFKRMGGVLQEMWNDFRSGQDTWAKWMRDARTFADKMIKDYGMGKWLNGKETLRFTTQRGETIELNRQLALSLYATWQRETRNTVQNANHLRMGGFRYPKGMKPYEGVDMKRPHALTSVDMLHIQDFLGKNAMEFADKMVGYLSNDMAKIGNEVSMQLYGYRKFTEKYYFPYQSSSDFLSQDLAKGDIALEDASGALKNWGAAKKLQTKANNPVVIGDFMDIWAGHVNKMCIYGAFTIPADNMNRLYNYKTPVDSDMTPTSVKQELSRVYGDGAGKYIATLIRDISGGVRAQDRTSVGKMVSKFKKGSVAGNLQVVVQQPSAIARVMAVMNPKYLMMPPGDIKKNIQEMREHSGVAIIKEMGRFDTGMGLSAVEWLQESVQEESIVKRGMERLDKFTGWGAEKADLLTWQHIWHAVKKEVEAKAPELEVGSREYYDAVTQRFEEVIDYTQVYDSVLAKSELMRSNSTFDKMTTSFMGEPTVTYNMLQDAIMNVKQMGGKKKLLRATSVWVTATAFNAMLKSLASALRRKDDEERTYIEKYIAEVWGNFSGDMDPISLIPIGRDIASLLEGYDVERADMAIYAQMVDAWNILWNDNKSFKDKIQAVTGAAGNMLGIPAKNIWRDAEALLNAFMANPDGGTDWRDIKYSVLDETPAILGQIQIWDDAATAYYARMADALTRGDMETFEELRGYLTETEGKKGSTVTSGVKGEVKESVIRGRIDEETAMDALEALGVESNAAYYQIDEWQAEAAHAGDEEFKYSKYDTLYKAVESGANLPAVVKDYMDHGVSKSTLASQITGQYKRQYIELMKTNPTAAANLKAMLLTAYAALGYDRKEYAKKIDKWLKE